MSNEQLTHYTRQLFAYLVSLTAAQRKVFYAGLQLDPAEEAIRQIGPLLSSIFEISMDPKERAHWVPAKPEELING